MASATVETFCCMASRVEPGILTRLHFDSLPYNIVCVISSICGMIGAIYQVLPFSPNFATEGRRSIGQTQKAIINWLAMADFFAAFGILLRSAFWLWKKDIVQGDTTWDLIICACLAFWIRFFYTATFLFTLCYAVDVYLVCKQRVGNAVCYHAFTWTGSFALTIVGLGTLYLPNFQCHNGIPRVLPNYLLSYIPIVLVMIINPILYYLSSKNVRILLTGGLGQLTYIEHNLLSALKEKFFCIVLVFYVCWIPNVINGVILWSSWFHLPKSVLIAVWYIMAVINPLQAVLNSLVYKGWENCGSVWRNLCVFCNCRDNPHSGLIIEESSSGHYTPEIMSFDR